MKFGQLTEKHEEHEKHLTWETANMRNIFHEKSYKKCGRETIPRLFSKKSKLSVSLDQYSKVLYILFLLLAKLRTIESDWN